MSTRRIQSLAWLCAFAFAPAWAQDAGVAAANVSPMTPLAPDNGTPPAASDAPAPITCCQLPDGALIELETLEPLSSARAKPGDRFRLRTTAALKAGDVLVLPAGTEGVGEVIHADKARSGGRAGELLLAARYLQLPDRTLPLRGMQLGRSGKDQTGASLAVSVALGPLGLFVQGGEVVIPAGTPAQAKLKGALELAPSSASPDNEVPTQPQKE
jgi:hypothetical protein